MTTFRYAKYSVEGDGQQLDPDEKVADWYRLAKGYDLATMGDSMAAWGFIPPDMSSNGPVTWARVLSGQRIRSSFDLNFGVSGTTVAQAVNTLDAVIAASPSFVFVNTGTNDVDGAGTSLPDIIKNLDFIYSKLLGAGITPLATCIPPRSFAAGGGLMTTANQQRAHYVNNWIRNRVRRTRGFILIDVWKHMVDPATGRSIGDGVLGTPPGSTAYTVDGLHYSPRGAYWMGKLISDALALYLNPIEHTSYSPNDTYDVTNNPTGNCMVNGFLTTAAGGTLGTGASGTVAGSWTVQRQVGTTGAAVCSVVTKTLPNGQTYNQQQLVISAPAGSATERIAILQQRFLTGLIGKKVIGQCEIEVAAPAAANCIKGIYLRASDGITVAADLQVNLGFLMPDVAWNGTLKSEPFTLAANVQEIQIRVEFDGTVASAGITIKVGRIEFRVVDPINGSY